MEVNMEVNMDKVSPVTCRRITVDDENAVVAEIERAFSAAGVDATVGCRVTGDDDTLVIFIRSELDADAHNAAEELARKVAGEIEDAMIVQHFSGPVEATDTEPAGTVFAVTFKSVVPELTPAEAWAAYVGDQTPTEFMEGERDPAAAARDYMANGPLSFDLTREEEQVIAAKLAEYLVSALDALFWEVLDAQQQERLDAERAAEVAEAKSRTYELVTFMGGPDDEV